MSSIRLDCRYVICNLFCKIQYSLVGPLSMNAFCLGYGSFDVTARISHGGWWPNNKLHAASTSEIRIRLAVIRSLVCSPWLNLIAITKTFAYSKCICRHGQDFVSALVRSSSRTWVLLCPLYFSLLSLNQMWASLLQARMVNLMMMGMF